MVNFTQEKDGDLNSTYNIGVYSISDCIFTLNVIIERELEEGMHEIEKAIKLHNGIP